MPSASSIRNKIDGASNKYQLHGRDIYKRVTTKDSVNSLLIESSSVNQQDTLLDPQPFFARPEKLDIGTIKAPTNVLSADGTAMLENVEYEMFCSSNCLSLNDIQNPNLTIVFKDVQSNEEEFRITDFEPFAFQGEDVAYTIYIKSFKKQNGTTNNNVNDLGG